MRIEFTDRQANTLKIVAKVNKEFRLYEQINIEMKRLRQIKTQIRNRLRQIMNSERDNEQIEINR